MKKIRNPVLKSFAALLALLVLADAHDQSGFISVDCGTEVSYTDKPTSINYTPDSQYTENGINMDISKRYENYTLQQRQLNNVRSFPDGIKNCYTLNPPQGKSTSYLIRAYFMYGNYDSLVKPPIFDLYLGVDLWDTVRLQNASQIVSKEIIHAPSTDYLYVCLVNIGSGTPFMSGLELRHLNDSIYTRESGSLVLVDRYYTYTNSFDDIRYNDDIYDRIWEPMYLPDGTYISTTQEVSNNGMVYNLPSSVMQAAITPTNLSSDQISIIYDFKDSNTESHFYLHLAELQSLSSGQVREFNVTVNRQPFYGPYVPEYLLSQTMYTTIAVTGSRLNITFQSTARSTLPPIVNAVEIFTVKYFSGDSTNQLDVEAIMEIKSSYELTKIWQGDPCVPRAYSWAAVNCSYDTSTSTARITSLNLSSSGLTGNIPYSVTNLTALRILDLSGNKLSGQIPDFLSDLPLLKTLNLKGNNFSGPVPEKLLERSRNGSLFLSVGNNPGLCSSTSCIPSKKTKRSFVGLAIGIAALLVILSAGSISFFIFRRRRKAQTKTGTERTATERDYNNKRKGGFVRFSYSEVKDMTRNFERELGKGGFGVVYYGRLKDDAEVAVKLLSKTIHASEQFSTEVELLMAIRHKNLVSLVGYCEEGDHLALIFEYMANGNLQTVLSATHSLTWKERLRIAIDSAQGLDYLHTGCRPPIVHRDVKSANILLNKNLQAKIADFGLSKIFPDENRSFVSTRVIGSPGYLDLEYQETYQLTEKSDVYSFGVVLLELITGKPAVVTSEIRCSSLVQWVRPLLERGDMWSIVDQKLQEVQNPNSIWRSVDIATACVGGTLSGRPTMSQIVTELKECLAVELESDPATSRAHIRDDSVDVMSLMISSTMSAPTAR